MIGSILPSVANIKNALRLARREIRGGLRGFYIFLACIALGTGAIAAVNSVSRAVTSAIATEGQSILAGDVRFELRNREATAEERAYLDGLGKIAVSTGLRSMARLADGSEQTLTEVKAVDGAYPLYGAFVADPNRPLSELLAANGDTYGAVAAPLLLERLGIKVGDDILLGNVKLKLTGTVVDEPDALSDGFGFAPRLMVSRDALFASGLVQNGSLVEHAYKIMLNDPAARATMTDAANKTFPDAGWSIRTSDRAAPSLTENVNRFSQFLTLVGLTALIVGGVGVANAVRAFLDSKRTTIASLKCLGAPASVVTMTYLFQIVFIAAVGIIIGLAVGAIAPLIAMRFLEGLLPVPKELAFYPAALGLAALFGILTTLAFAIVPLGQAREVPATALFREQGFEEGRLAVLALSRSDGLVVGCAGHTCHLFGRRTFHRLGFPCRHRLRVCGAATGGVRRQGHRQTQPARSFRRPSPGDRQYSPAGCAHPLRRSLPRPRADAAGDPDADRRQSAPRTDRQPAGTSAEFLLRGYSGHRVAGFPRSSQARSASGNADRGADAARPHSGS